MDYDGSQWPQGIINGVVNKPIREDTPSSSRETLERRAIRSQKGPQQEADLNCPRCNSTNTKFCYYNNYSLSQPRHFCKTCRRYWTQGGSLRNVPVGGGSRKNKRSSSTTTTTTTTSSTKKNVIGSPNLTPPAGSLIQSNPQNPILIQGHDLNLAYDSHLPLLRQNPSFASCESSWGNFMVLNNFPQPGSADSIGNVYPSGRLFSPLQELKPTLHYFSLRNETTNGLGSGIGGNSNGNAQERTKARGGDGDDALIYEHGNSRRQGDHSPGGHNWNSSGMFGGGGSWQL